jgi:hypothetical protein
MSHFKFFILSLIVLTAVTYSFVKNPNLANNPQQELSKLIKDNTQ